MDCVRYAKLRWLRTLQVMVEIRTTSPEETRAWGERLAHLLFPGAVIGLEGELGAGKTCFAKGLATGLGIDEEEIYSPTFTLIAEHYRGKGPLYHIDLYRLESVGVEGLGLEDYLSGQGVSVIEWFNFLPAGMADACLLITFAFVGDDERLLTFTARGEPYERVVRALLEGAEGRK
jgi:tRNA threonylcarbamoyladenosine biosynthesis protein TsaE